MPFSGMFKGMAGAISPTSKMMGAFGFPGGKSKKRKSGFSLKEDGPESIFNQRKSNSVGGDGFERKSYRGDINLPLSGSVNPEHRAIARRQAPYLRPSMDPGSETNAASAFQNANMEQGEKKGIFANIMEGLSKFNPIEKAAGAALGQREGEIRRRR